MTILSVVGAVLGILVGIVLVYLAVIIFFPIRQVEAQPMTLSADGFGQAESETPASRMDVSFEVNGERVGGRLFWPRDLSRPVPCVVMNNGFGGTMEMGVEPFALRFAEAGLAALTYDYRHFGESEGQPRQMYSAAKQIDDCQAAVEYAMGRDEIDPGRIAIWGTSSGGGYGLVIAARDKRIACVCGQCPAVDGHADGKMALEREGLWFFLRFLPHAQRDKGRSRFGLSSHTVPLVGPPGTRAILTSPGAFEGYSRLAAGKFRNEVCARLALTHDHKLNPIGHVKDVRCPVLLQICEDDNIVASSGAQEAAGILGDKAVLERYPGGHFDLYFGGLFERCVTDQIEFLGKHLS